MQRQLKSKPCRACRKEFTPWRLGQVACSPLCAMQVAQDNTRRKLARAKRDGRIQARTRRDWVKIAQGAFNAYIRGRDKNQPCISCGRSSDAKQNAGHYRSVGAAPQLRFNEDNCHKQCEHCNSFLSGNLAGYRPGLIERIGLARVELLEADNGVLKIGVDELKAVIQTYRAKVKTV